VTATFPDGRACSASFAYGTSADEVEAKWQRAVAKAPPSTSTAREVAKAIRGSGVKAHARKGVVRVIAKGKGK